MTTPSQSKDAEFVKRIENLEAQVESIMADAKSEAADIRLDIKEVLKEAKAEGVNLKALRAVVKARKIRAKLKAAEQDQFDLIRHSLGDLADLPLGQAALDQAAA